jgi:hypothetical protein
MLEWKEIGVAVPVLFCLALSLSCCSCDASIFFSITLFKITPISRNDILASFAISRMVLP